MLLPDDTVEVHGPWLILILAHFYNRQYGKLFYLMASLLSQQMVVSVGCHMPVVVHKEIDLVRCLPHSVCLCLGVLSADLGQLLSYPCPLSATSSYAVETNNLEGCTEAQIAWLFWTLDPSHSNSDGLVEWVFWCLYKSYSKVTRPRMWLRTDSRIFPNILPLCVN